VLRISFLLLFFSFFLILKAQEEAFTQIQEYMGNRLYSQASSALEQLIRKYPEDPQQDRWFLEQIRVYHYLKDDLRFEETVALFEKKFPESLYLGKVRLFYADFLWKKEKSEESLLLYAQHLEALLNPSYQKRLVSYSFQQGLQSFREGFYEKAVYHFSQVLQLIPNFEEEEDFHYYLNLARFYQETQKKSDRQFLPIRQAVEQQLQRSGIPKTPFHYLKGKILLEEGQGELARMEFLKFLKLRERNPPGPDQASTAQGYYEMGNSYLQQGFLTDAWEWYRQAIQASPDLEVEIMRKMVESAYQKGRYQDVIQWATHSDFPKIFQDPSIRYRLGMSYQQLGDLKNAEQVFVDFLGNFPDVPLWQEVRQELPTMIFEYIHHLWQNFRYPEAREWIQKFTERFPNDKRAPQLLFQEGERLEDSGLIEEAKKIYSLIEARFPDSPFASQSLWNLMTLTLGEAGEEKHYQRYCHKLLTQFPQSSPAQRAEEFLQTQTQKFLKMTSPLFSNGLENPVLEIQSQHLRYLTFKAYPVDISSYLHSKKNLYFKELEALSVDVILPDPDKVWEVDLTQLENPQQITVPFRQPGVYMIRAFGEEQQLTATTILTISTLKVLARPLEGQIFLYVQDEIKQEPVEKAKVTLFLEGKEYLQTQTQSDGVVFIDFPHQTRTVTCLIQKDSQVYFHTFEFTPKVVREPAYALFAFTDQRFYSPKDSICLYGWTRKIEKNQSISLSEKEPVDKIKIQWFNTQERLIQEEILTPDPQGFFEKTFTFSPQMTPGTYLFKIQQEEARLQLPFLLQSLAPFDFRVECPERVLPNDLPLKILIHSEDTHPLNPIELNAQIFLFPSLENAEEEPSIFWKASNYSLKHTQEELVVETKDIPYDCRLQLILTARLDQKEIQSEHYFVIKKKPFYLALPYTRGWSYPQDGVKIPFYLNDAVGWPLQQEGHYQIISISTSQIPVPIFKTWKTESTGKAEIAFSLAQTGLYRIEIFVGKEEDPYFILWEVRPKPAFSLLWESPQRHEFLEQEAIPLHIRFPFEETLAILTIEREQVLTYHVLFVRQGQISLKLPPQALYLPEIKIRIAFLGKGEWIEEEFVCHIYQNIVFASELQKDQGLPNEANVLKVQLQKKENLHFFALAVPHENISPSLNRSTFLQNFFRFPSLLTEESKFLESPLFSLEEESLLRDQNLFLLERSLRLEAPWLETEQHLQMEFRFPEIPRRL
jgi:tetratricopeptide (TPR) repeat protein